MSTTSLSTPVVTQLYDANNSTTVSSFSSVLDLRSAIDAFITIGADTGTAPTTQCVVNILYYHSASGTPPTAASASDGATGWKQIYQVGSGTTASTKNAWNFRPPLGGYLCIEFGASGTNTLTCEAFATVTPSSTTV